jgi:hypothetical protein
MSAKVERTIGPAKGTTTSKAPQTKNFLAAWEKLPSVKTAYKIAFEKLAEDVQYQQEDYKFGTGLPVTQNKNLLGMAADAIMAGAGNLPIGASIPIGTGLSIKGTDFDTPGVSPEYNARLALARRVGAVGNAQQRSDFIKNQAGQGDVNKLMAGRSWWDTVKEIPQAVMPATFARGGMTGGLKAAIMPAAMGATMGAALGPGGKNPTTRDKVLNVVDSTAGFAAPSLIGAGIGAIRASPIAKLPIAAAALSWGLKGYNRASYEMASDEKQQELADKSTTLAMQQRNRSRDSIAGRLGVLTDNAIAALSGDIHAQDAAQAALFDREGLDELAKSYDGVMKWENILALKQVLKARREAAMGQ